MNMVTPAMQLASKIPDVHVQLWAAAILKVPVTDKENGPNGVKNGQKRPRMD